jgi:hypothetical protein
MVAALVSPFRLAAGFHLLPTVLFLWPLCLCRALVKLLSRKALLLQKIRLTKRRRRRSEHRRSRLRPAIRQDVKLQLGPHKRARKGAMEELTKEAFNGHLWRSPSRTCQIKLLRAQTRRPPVSFSPPFFPLHLLESFSAYGGQGLEQEARGAIAVSAATENGVLVESLKDPNEESIR